MTTEAEVLRRAPIASLRGVTKSYTADGVEERVLDGLDLGVEEGELLVVLGRSGSGKTTLLNLLGGLDRPDGGIVRACGVDLHRASRKELTAYRARCVGFVFQFYNLVPTLTALENVEAGLTVGGVPAREARTRGRELLARVGLAGKADSFPRQLSGGQQQRVAVARAFAKRPPLVLADEPTGNLDEENAAVVADLLHELIREHGTTAVIVTHNQSLADVGTAVVELQRHTVEGPR